MTDAAFAVESSVGSSTSPGRVGRFARPPEWLWAAMVPLQVVVAIILTSYTYFFYDDFLFLAQAREQAFGETYLRESLFEHFSPISRLLDKVIVTVAPGSFGFAHAVQLLIYAAAIVAFASVVRFILGRTWLALALTVLFGQSPFLMRMLTWWIATVNLLPASACMLLAIADYLRWWARGDRRWLALSVVAFVGGVLDYETTMLLPGFLLIIRLLVLEDSLDPRQWLRTLWSERLAWIPIAVIEVAAIVNFERDYYVNLPRATPGQLLHFLESCLVRAFIPALVGLKRVQTAGTVATAAAVVVFCVIVGVTIFYRPRAWRCLLGALLAFLLSMAPVGLERYKLSGIDAAFELYYQQSAQFMFLILLAFGLTERWGGRRTGRALPRPPRPAVVAAMLAAIAGYAVLYVSSANALATSAFQARETKQYFALFLPAAHAIQRTTGQDPNLINLPVPNGIMPSAYTPYDEYSNYLTVIDAHLRFNDPFGPAFIVAPSGELEPVHFIPLSAGHLAAASVTTVTEANARPAHARAGVACVPSGPQARLHLPLVTPVTVPATATALPATSTPAPYAIRVSYEMPVGAAVDVLVSNPGGVSLADGDPHYWRAGRGVALALEMRATTVDDIQLDLPGGACVTGVTVGRYVPGR